jgi:hypothetical protein
VDLGNRQFWQKLIRRKLYSIDQGAIDTKFPKKYILGKLLG